MGFKTILVLSVLLHLGNTLECYQCKVDATMCSEENDLEVTDCDFVSYHQSWPGVEISTTAYNYNDSYALEDAPYPFVTFAKGCLSLEYDAAVLKSCVRYDVALKDTICEHIASTTAYTNCNFCDSKRCNGSSAIEGAFSLSAAIIINVLLINAKRIY